jgi:prepilin-type N-terminal cleavage/methylation domain-containing protein
MRRRGFTLIEMLVVLAIMGLAAVMVVPALTRQFRAESSFQTVLASARDQAAARGEVIYLRIDPSGQWHTEGGGSTLEGDVTRGRIAPLATAAVTLIVSPTGSCAFDVRSAGAAHFIPLDPLSCTTRDATSRTSW